MLRKLHTALAVPAMYDGFQRFMKRDEGYTRFVQQFVRPEAGMTVLDLGCGTGKVMDYIHVPITYKGYDLSPEYIGQARKEFGAKGTYQVGRIPDCLIEETGKFDIVIAVGLLHHLNDADITSMLAHAVRVLKPGGRFVSIDCAYVKGQSIFARWLISADRGEHVREASEYMALVRQHFSSIEPVIAHNWARLPYTHIVITASRSIA
jgi:cyclopropane fatty-acyl-phospholipid synthase-like methyltransferase